MSLGWQCESALLPSKAKPIHLSNNSSMVGLKAVIFANEQKKNISVHPKSINPNWKIKSELRKLGESKEKNIKKNSKEDVVYDALSAKALIYEEMASGLLFLSWNYYENGLAK